MKKCKGTFKVNEKTFEYEYKQLESLSDIPFEEAMKILNSHLKIKARNEAALKVMGKSQIILP